MNSLELIKLYQKDAFIKSLSYWLNDDKTFQITYAQKGKFKIKAGVRILALEKQSPRQHKMRSWQYCNDFGL